MRCKSLIRHFSVFQRRVKIDLELFMPEQQVIKPKIHKMYSLQSVHFQQLQLKCSVIRPIESENMAFNYGFMMEI